MEGSVSTACIWKVTEIWKVKDTCGVCLGLGTILQGEFNASLLEMPKIGARKIPKTSEGAPCHGLLWRWLGSPMFGYLLVASCRLDKNPMKFRL